MTKETGMADLKKRYRMNTCSMTIIATTIPAKASATLMWS
jgi:hypothetical protein